MQVDRVVFKDVPVEVQKVNVREVMIPYEKIVYKDVQVVAPFAPAVSF